MTKTSEKTGARSPMPLAALTGDLVKSSGLTVQQLAAAKQALTGAAETIQARWQALRGTIDFYRGDGWQMLVDKPHLALRISLFLRAYMISAGQPDTRIAIGFGAVQHLDLRRISQSTGKAFELSGHLLDTMGLHRRLAALAAEDAPPTLAMLPAAVALADAVCQKWTPRQAQLVALVLQGVKQVDAAQQVKPPITPQAVAKQLKSAGWFAIEAALETVEQQTCWQQNKP